MKKIAILIVFFLLFTSCKQKVNYENELKWPENETNIYISSDFHWQLEDTNFRVDYLNETINTLLYQTVNDNPSALIICGDITNGGKIQEHLEITALLEKAENNGANIFVVMGNHDMDAKVNTQTLKDMYARFGFSEAFSSDEKTMSYAAKLNEEIWLLSLDLNVYADIESDMAGYVSTETLLWIEEILIKAENEGAMVLPFSHHNLIPHAMEDLTHHYNIENGEELRDLLLEYAVPVYLSGHRHSSFIASYEDNQRTIDELVIDMAASYPYRFTEIVFNENYTISYNTKKIDIQSFAIENNLQDEDLQNFDKVVKENFQNQLAENSNSIYNLTDDVNEAEKLKEYYIDVLSAQKERTLYKYSEEFKNDEALKLWMEYEDENIFGRWIPWVLENQTNDNENQILGPYR